MTIQDHQLKSAIRTFREVLHDVTAGEHVEIEGEKLEQLQWLSDKINEMTPAALDVAIERARQIDQCGYTSAHDDKLPNGGLTELAKSYIAKANIYSINPSIEALTKAAACLTAEIDSLKRLELAATQEIAQ